MARRRPTNPTSRVKRLAHRWLASRPTTSDAEVVRVLGYVGVTPNDAILGNPVIATPRIVMFRDGASRAVETMSTCFVADDTEPPYTLAVPCAHYRPTRADLFIGLCLHLSRWTPDLRGIFAHLTVNACGENRAVAAWGISGISQLKMNQHVMVVTGFRTSRTTLTDEGFLALRAAAAAVLPQPFDRI